MRTHALPPPGWLVKVVVLHPTVVSSFECFVFESWVLCFRDSGASFSSFGCFVLRSSFSRASFSKLPTRESVSRYKRPLRRCMRINILRYANAKYHYILPFRL